MAGVTTMTILALAGLLGVGAGIGLWLIIIGVVGVDRSADHGVDRSADGSVDGAGTDRPRPAWRERLAGRPAGGRPLGVRLLWCLVVAVVVGVLTGWVAAAILAGLACWGLPRVVGRDRNHARRVARIEAIATWTEMLRDTLSAAAGLEQAILATAPIAPAAIRAEITDLAARLETGERLAPSLRRVADQLADPTADLVVSALVLAAGQQAKQLGDLLGSLAAAARDQVSMRLRIEAGRARTRTSVRVIVGTTLAFAVLLVLLNRSYLAAYDSAFGQVMLLGVGAAFTAGITWLARISRLREPARVLHAGTSTDPGGLIDLGADTAPPAVIAGWPERQAPS